jgi:hypothetical protein
MLIGGFFPSYMFIGGCKCQQHYKYLNWSFLPFGFFGILSGIVLSYPIHRLIIVANSKPDDKKVPLSRMARYAYIWIWLLPAGIFAYMLANEITHKYFRIHPNNKYKLIHLFATKDNFTVAEVERALQEGAEIGIPSNYYCFPLGYAVAEGNENVVELLIKNGADVNIGNVINGPPLFTAIYHNNLDMISLLIRHGADVNLADASGETPLEFGLKSEGKAEVISLLRSHGAKTAAELKAEGK